MNLQLSDGTVLQVPDDATPDMIRNFSARGEAHIKANPAPAAAAPAAAPQDPNSVGNILGRVGTDAVLGIPDLGIAAYNAFLASDDGRVRPLGERARSALGVAELPEDAPWYQRWGEGLGSGLLTGGVGVGRAVVKEGAKAGLKTLGKTVVAPTIGGDVGGQAGAAIGGEKGAVIGGVLGGASPHAKSIGENWVQGRYVGKGAANAPEIAAAAERLGIEPTAGALGNYDIQKRENALAQNYPGGLNTREQARIGREMTATGEDIGAQRGGTGQGPAAIGDDIVGATTDRLAADRDYSSAGQENLQRTVGDRAPVRVIDLIEEAKAAYPHLSVPGRQALEYRIAQLTPLISQKDARGMPIIGPNSTVPYELVKQFRTELGQSFEQGRIPRNQELYGPTTDAMGATAERAGVPRGDFNQVQQFTRGVEGPGGLAERLGPFDKEPGAAYNYTLEGGLKNPDRLQTFATETAGDPRQRVFGDYLQQKVGETLGTNSAQGPNRFAQFVEGADPRALGTIAGPQAPRLQDLATLARGVDVPTSQRGQGTSMGGVANDLGGKFLGSEMLGQIAASIDPSLGPAGRGLGWFARPALAWAQQRIMQSDAAKRGMLGQPMAHRMTIQDLIQTLNTIGRTQPPPEQQGY